MSLTEQTRDELRALTQRYPVARAALLPMLHLVQSVEGYVSEDGIAMCAEVLGLTKAEVGAVATFYTMYKREPVGDYLLSVCTNPTCKIAGGQDIYEAYVDACGGGHTDPDGAGIMVEHAECLAICDAAPVVQINYEMYGPVTTDEAMDLLAKAKAGDPPASPRSGEVPRTFREVEREFSGIDDAFGAHLVEAARRQATSAVPPSYRTGETDIPVTHPGGDPFGHGGRAFALEAQLDRGPHAPDADAVDAAADASATTPPPGHRATPDQRAAASETAGEDAYGEAQELADHVEDGVPGHTPPDATTGGALPGDVTSSDPHPDPATRTTPGVPESGPDPDPSPSLQPAREDEEEDRR